MEKTAAPASQSDGPLFTCPMHPEVLRDAPGSCPQCGMALEPVTPVADAGDNAELIDMQRRFRMSAVLSLPLVVIAMGDLIPGRPLGGLEATGLKGWIELLLATPVVLWAAIPFFERAWQSIVHRSLNMFTLIGLGVAASYLFSIVAQVFPHIFPASFRTASG